MNAWIAAHFVRWLTWTYLIWVMVLPETGPWTAVVLTLSAAGIEVLYLNPKHWTKN